MAPAAWERLVSNHLPLQEITYTTGSKVTKHPLGVAVTLLLVGEHGLVGVTEGEVQSLGGEVTDDVGSVTSPERNDTLGGGGTAEAVHDTGVLAVKTASLEHFILVLDEQLNTLNGGGSGLGDGSGNTTHYREGLVLNTGCFD